MHGVPQVSSTFFCFRIADLQADEEVYNQLAAAEVPPFFALGWFITWFAHSVDSLQHISRLFDLFMASHPLMPLYVTAVVIKVLSLQQHIVLIVYSLQASCSCAAGYASCSLHASGDTTPYCKHASCCHSMVQTHESRQHNP